MKSLFKGLVMGSVLTICAGSANAGVINFNTCWSSCTSLGTVDGTVLAQPVATLSYVDNGLGGVDFVLTNMMGNLFPGEDEEFLRELLFNIDAAPDSISFVAGGIIQSINSGAFNDAGGLDYDIQVRLGSSNAGNGAVRLENGESVTWTFGGFTEAEVLLPAQVHIQGLGSNGQNSVKVIGTVPQDVPEPGILLLFGAGLLGLGVVRKAKA